MVAFIGTHIYIVPPRGIPWKLGTSGPQTKLCGPQCGISEQRYSVCVCGTCPALIPPIQPPAALWVEPLWQRLGDKDRL